jgi:hypothetical protein
LAQPVAQISNGSEQAARDDIALDLGKPQLHLIQPRRVDRGDVKAHLGGEEQLDVRGLLHGKIVEHDMNPSIPLRALDQPFHKRDELAAALSGGSHAVHGAGLHVQGRVQRKRAVAIVFKAVPLRRKRVSSNERSFSNPKSCTAEHDS